MPLLQCRYFDSLVLPQRNSAASVLRIVRFREPEPIRIRSSNIHRHTFISRSLPHRVEPSAGPNMAAPVSVCVCVLLLLPAAPALHSEDVECAFSNNLQEAGPHNGTTTGLPGVAQKNGTVRCSHGSRCYGLWEKQADGEMHLVNQGCWSLDTGECQHDHCLVTATPSRVRDGRFRFCCCSRDLCNTNFTEAPPTADTTALRLINSDDRQTDQPLRREETALVALVIVAIAAIFIMALFLGYRMMKGKQKHAPSALDVLEAANSECVDLDNLKLLLLIGRGRYGTVFRGSLNEHCVAVKLFSSAHRQNFANECSIYRLPLLRQHDNISRFLTADERTTADAQPEFLIVMEYYPHGSLSHFLSGHTVDWLTCCRMCWGVTRGLSFLHTELYAADQCKPAVAHRDVTSRNVLVRADLSCVLADFGLSMQLTGRLPCRPGDEDMVAISEVGTVRYMAPEVLGGALNLRDCESALKQVDVYALGLLYWESFRRCSDLFSAEAAPPFQLAFQEELGGHPSLEEMQELVVRGKHRPRFPDAWKENSLVLRSLKETMEDCWDQDAEARLTAQCAEERLSELTLLSSHTHRNLSQGRRSPQVGPASSHTEDPQVGVVRNLQGEPHVPSVTKTTTIAAEVPGKKRNLINYERQQSQARASSSDSASCPATSSVSEHTRGLPLTGDDLEAKFDPRKVHKNLRENSEENLMEHSQKQFSSRPDPQDSSSTVVPWHDAPPSSSTLPKQQNLPKRPTSLHLVPKTMETVLSSSRWKLEKLKWNHRQVETGVAKMNTVTVATAAEPHLVTTVTNSSSRGGAVQLVGVPTLVTNAMIARGQTNPAGPQLDEDDVTKEGVVRREDSHVNLLSFSPDEDEPLLRREPPQPRGSNANNNNNNGAGSAAEVDLLGSEVRDVLRPKPEQITRDPECQDCDNTALEPADQVEQNRTSRPERPRSLDLSLSFPCSDNVSLSSSGEKIKRRVKTPYTLKKWRPASWVVSRDSAVDWEFASSTRSPPSLHGTRRLLPEVKQSKSSMAVFCVGHGASGTSSF